MKLNVVTIPNSKIKVVVTVGQTIRTVEHVAHLKKYYSLFFNLLKNKAVKMNQSIWENTSYQKILDGIHIYIMIILFSGRIYQFSIEFQITICDCLNKQHPLE